LPKSQHSKAKRALQEIWMAETKKDALTAFDAFESDLTGPTLGPDQRDCRCRNAG
jgi:hypothetical protein